MANCNASNSVARGGAASTGPGRGDELRRSRAQREPRNCRHDRPMCISVKFAWPNVRAKRVTTAGRQAREPENSKGRLAGLVACRWRSA